MNIVAAENVKKTYGEKVLLDHISFGIDEGERIGLIGVNGTGKSTLLKLLAGVDVPDSGKLVRAGRVTVHYLPQEPDFDPHSTVLEQVFRGEAPVMKLLLAYEELLGQISHSTPTSAEQTKLIRLQSELESMGAWELEHEAKTILTRLGITNFEAQVGTLSGGQRKRIALASALIEPSDLLILDEPTNHIDSESVAWLEGYLQKRKGALFMITHDRYFLDRVVNRIFELDHGHLYRYPGNYQVFLESKLEREAQARASEDKRQNFLRNEIEWIKKGPKARGTKQKARTERYYEVLEEGPQESADGLELSSVKSRLGNTVIDLEGVTKSFECRTVIDDFTYTFVKTDRVGIVGPNGSGKSTLLKLMMKEVEPDKGTVTIGSTVKIGYFSQEHDELDPNQRVIDYIRDEAEYVETIDGHMVSASQMLERFLFPGSLQWTPIGKLSGGEKRRLVLLHTLMSAPNVLLLDEPTNDLDIPTLAVLESFLDDFPGVVVVVSHDRYFLDRVVDKLFAFSGNGEIKVSTGNYADYLARAELETDAPTSDAGQTVVKTEKAEVRTRSDRTRTVKFTFKEQKEYEEIDDQIASTEATLARVTRDMDTAGSDYGKLQELYAMQQTLVQKLDELMERWTYLNELAEEIERSHES